MTLAVPTSPWDVAANRLDPLVDYLADPKRWVDDKTGEYLWARQREILDSVRDNRRTAVPSCHESGKSFTAARAVCWWLDAHAPGEAFAVTTAPSGPQVKAILWREINRAHAKGRLIGRCLQTEWKIGNELIAFGRKPADYNEQAFQGIHAKYVLVVIDEACGVPRQLWDAADTLIANETGRILAIGNPDDPGAYFAEVCKPGSGWNVLPISAYDTPNFTEEWVPADVASALISPLWVEEKKKSWGEDSPLYISKVKGEFPTAASDAVVPWQWVQQCRKLEPRLPFDETNVRLGLDVGAGGDMSVVREMRGWRVGRAWRNHSADPQQVVGMTVQAIRESGAQRLKVDIIGWGWGVAGHIAAEVEAAQQAGTITWNVDIIPVNVAESPVDRGRFVNLRDEIWWEVGRELSRLGRWDLGDLEDDTLAQLVAPKYRIPPSGLIKVEPKDETRKRLGRSPDDADALLLAAYEPPGAEWGAA